jgi:hypothetical protein
LFPHGQLKAIYASEEDVPMNSSQNALSNTSTQTYWVGHPLDDHPESKRDVSILGPIAMTPSVRLSLLALRAYLILMTSLVAYHFSALPPHSGIYRVEHEFG